MDAQQKTHGVGSDAEKEEVKTGTESVQAPVQIQPEQNTTDDDLEDEMTNVRFSVKMRTMLWKLI